MSFLLDGSIQTSMTACMEVKNKHAHLEYASDSCCSSFLAMEPEELTAIQTADSEMVSV